MQTRLGYLEHVFAVQLGSTGLVPAEGYSSSISQLRFSHDFNRTLKGAELSDAQQLRFFFSQGQGTT